MTDKLIGPDFNDKRSRRTTQRSAASDASNHGEKICLGQTMSNPLDLDGLLKYSHSPETLHVFQLASLHVGRVLQPHQFFSILSLPRELLSWSTPTGVRGCLKTFNPAMIVVDPSTSVDTQKTSPSFCWANSPDNRLQQLVKESKEKA